VHDVVVVDIDEAELRLGRAASSPTPCPFGAPRGGRRIDVDSSRRG
jgi:hypothetical protein